MASPYDKSKQALAQARCFFHAQREAVAQCPSCGHTYCRECITDHNGRVLCATCLAQDVTSSKATGHTLKRRVFTTLSAGLGLVLAWLFFYGLAALLLRIPAIFHEGRFGP